MPKGAGSRPTRRPFQDLQHKHKKCVLLFVFLILWENPNVLGLNIYIFSRLLLLFSMFSVVVVVVVVVVVFVDVPEKSIGLCIV